MKSLIIKGTILLFLVSNSLSKSKYYLVETADKVKLPNEIKNDDQQRQHNKGMNDKVFSYNSDIQPLMSLVKSWQKCLRHKVTLKCGDFAHIKC